MDDDRAASEHPPAPSSAARRSRSLGRDVHAVTALLPGGGEERPGQLMMAEAVERAISRGRHLVAQAGTGTGKTLAYLLPAIRSGATVVVSTATRALQDQLAQSDLPQLQRALGGDPPVSYAVLKGRSNYLCVQRAAEVAGRGTWRSASAAPSGDLGARSGSGFDPDDGVAGTNDEAARPAAGAGRLLPRRPPPPPAVPAALPGLQDAAGDTDPGDRANIDPTDPAGSAPATATGVTVAEPAAGEPAVTADGLATTGATPPARLVDEVRRLLAWAVGSSTGDRADLDFEPDHRAWDLVSVGPRECPGAYRCPSGDDCFAERARARAAAAQVVVVNTALLTADLAAGGTVLPEHDVLVIDEAHEAEEIIGQGLGVEITPGRLRAAASSARGLVAAGYDPLGPLAASADELHRVLSASAGRRVDLGRDADLAVVLATARARVDNLARALRTGTDGGPETDANRRARALLAAGHLADDIATATGDDPDRVLWIAGTERSPALRSTPIDVGPILATRLWPAVTAVLCSATMPPGAARRLGLPAGGTDEIDVGSPFPYRENALLYVPRHLPDRRAPGADGPAHDELVDLVLAAGGRTLALFTSWRAMEAAVTAAAPRVPFPVLAQGERPKRQLLESFAGDEATCLFATLSFWQGVDVPGRTASLVVIDRLPFPRPDDPLLQARRERAGPGAFQLIDLPRAATLLAQGAGRLVRRASDRGVVAVLDPRLATARYRSTLLAVVPPMRRTVDRDEVLGFLRALDTAKPSSRAEPPSFAEPPNPAMPIGAAEPGHPADQ